MTYHTIKTISYNENNTSKYDVFKLDCSINQLTSYGREYHECFEVLFLPVLLQYFILLENSPKFVQNTVDIIRASSYKDSGLSFHTWSN